MKTNATTIDLVCHAPIMNAANLDLYEIALRLCPLVLVSISTSLVMLPAKMNPEMLRNHAGAHFVPAKNMRDGFALRAVSVAVIDVHAYRLRTGNDSSGGRAIRRRLLKWRLGRRVFRVIRGRRGRLVCHGARVNSVNVHGGKVWRGGCTLVDSGWRSISSVSKAVSTGSVVRSKSQIMRHERASGAIA